MIRKALLGLKYLGLSMSRILQSEKHQALELEVGGLDPPLANFGKIKLSDYFVEINVCPRYLLKNVHFSSACFSKY